MIWGYHYFRKHPFSKAEIKPNHAHLFLAQGASDRFRTCFRVFQELAPHSIQATLALSHGRECSNACAYAPILRDANAIPSNSTRPRFSSDMPPFLSGFPKATNPQPFSGLRCLHFLQHGHGPGPYILLPGHPEIFGPTNPRSVAAACKTFPLPWPVTLHCELVGKDCLRFFEEKPRGWKRSVKIQRSRASKELLKLKTLGLTWTVNLCNESDELLVDSDSGALTLNPWIT